MDCGTKFMSTKAFVKMSITCFTLALKFLPSTDNSMKAKVSCSRATAILIISDSTQFDLATSDAKTYVEQYPSVKVMIVYVLYLRSTLHNCFSRLGKLFTTNKWA